MDQSPGRPKPNVPRHAKHPLPDNRNRPKFSKIFVFDKIMTLGTDLKRLIATELLM